MVHVVGNPAEELTLVEDRAAMTMSIVWLVPIQGSLVTKMSPSLIPGSSERFSRIHLTARSAPALR